MACCGHHEDRFQNSVDKNFFCPICQEVLKDPVQCPNPQRTLLLQGVYTTSQEFEDVPCLYGKSHGRNVD